MCMIVLLPSHMVQFHIMYVPTDHTFDVMDHMSGRVCQTLCLLCIHGVVLPHTDPHLPICGKACVLRCGFVVAAEEARPAHDVHRMLYAIRDLLRPADSQRLGGSLKRHKLGPCTPFACSSSAVHSMWLDQTSPQRKAFSLVASCLDGHLCSGTATCSCNAVWGKHFHIVARHNVAYSRDVG